MLHSKSDTSAAHVLPALDTHDLAIIAGGTKRHPRPIIRIPGRDIYGRPKHPFPLPLPPKGPRKV